jgi:UDP-glucose 4-epimerase
MKTVLITGGLGFVGGRLARKLSDSFHVIASSRNTVEQHVLELHGNVMPVLHQDLLSAEKFPENVDTLIHLAALNEWDCVKYPSEAIRVNIDETRIILENAIASRVKNFFYFSTAHVYGSPLEGLITEQKLPVPIHPYAITHKAAEDYVVAASIQKKIKGIVIRLSNSFGHPVSPLVNRWTLLANDLCRQAIEKRSLTLNSNGCQYRDFVCLTDVENTILAMIEQCSRFGKIVYNLGSGKSMSVLEIANTIASLYTSLFDRQIKINLPVGATKTEEPALEFSVERLLLDGGIIKNDVENELRMLLKFCHENFIPVD